VTRARSGGGGGQVRIRVLIADDDPAVRAALVELIESEPELELVGAASDATEVVGLAAATQPDVVLVDVRMPGGGGVTAARGIGRSSPASKVIALSGQGDQPTVLHMLEAGAVGYLLKGGSVDEVIAAIKRAPEGQSTLSAELTGGIIHELAGQLSIQARTRSRERGVERRIRRALDDERALTMAFQPITRLRERAVVGVEALARFAGPPTRAPSLWFAEAETVGLREELELSAARQAIGALPELPPAAYLTINVSPTTLVRSGFRKLLANADGSRLVVEVTEHAPIQDYASLSEALKALRELGIRFAIDDAGAGYSSLRHILELNPDLIKLDISLIRNIHRDTSKQALAAGLISFAAKIDASIIAEGIERHAEAAKLLELGVEYGQGYLLGRPGPLPLAERPGRRQVAPTPPP
jgi:EAL domain-containing protein (putative c-di-GMP-specific phosphodiesterase class I)/CheY-like chemotaxis protein